MTILYSEAQGDAQYLTRNLGREVLPKRVECDCDYSRRCYRCAGEGRYFIHVFASCGHDVVSAEDECVENYCAEREIAQQLPLEHKPLKSLREIQSERDALEAA